MDVLVSTGEQVTIALLCMALIKRGLGRALLYRQPGSHRHRQHPHQGADQVDRRSKYAARSRRPGVWSWSRDFRGLTRDGNITTLGRGGSDTTAVALAAALKADECQIYTDVDGVYTTDPRVVDDARRRLDKITFEEMLEMASLGSKVLQIRSVEFAGKYNVPVAGAVQFQGRPRHPDYL